MAKQETSLTDWLIVQDASNDIHEIIAVLGEITARISLVIRKAPKEGNDGITDSVNVQGEVQKTLDIVTHDLMVEGLSSCGQVAAMVSEEFPDLINNRSCAHDADIVACFDPLDGSSNIETNSAIGTIFSLLRVESKGAGVSEKDVLAASNNQIAAGYVLYGPASLLVLTLGKSVAVFTLDPESDEFLLVKDELSIVPEAAEFAINMAYQRFWEPALANYIADCVAGCDGPRAREFN
ncbi:Fructose-1,6-bisphosphatase, type I, partial [hydrothermal vent metagenome]